MSLRLSSSLFLYQTTFTDLCTNLYAMTEYRPLNEMFVHVIIISRSSSSIITHKPEMTRIEIEMNKKKEHPLNLIHREKNAHRNKHLNERNTVTVCSKKTREENM